jgi:hypothetical protein
MGRPSSQLHQFAGATILKVWMHDFTLRNRPEILALGPMDADGKNIHWATGEDRRNVRLWPKADISSCDAHVRFWRQSGHGFAASSSLKFSIQ